MVALSKAPGTWAASGEGRLSIAAPHAAELVLDPARLMLAVARLQSPHLLVSVPARGRITAMVDTDRHRAILCAEARAEFDAAQDDGVCPFPIIVKNGRLLGVVREPPKEQKMWWKVW